MALKRVVGLSFLFLLAGYFIMVVAEWSDAPRTIAIPVGIYEKLFVNTRNGLFEGFFYVALGAFSAQSMSVSKQCRSFIFLSALSLA